MKNLKLLPITLAFLFIFSTNVFSRTSIKVALILDTSNSMDGLINQAKSQLWSVVNELSKANFENDETILEIAIYEYGNDKIPMQEGYIRMVTPFTRDLDLISEKLFALKTLGGNEFCGQAIGNSLNQLEWGTNENNLKIIFIAGNEPFNQGNTSYKSVCSQAKIKNILVNTIFCGNYEEGINTHWKDGAKITGGEYMNINQNNQYVYVKSPYDDKIYSLNQSLNNTYISYGFEGQKNKTRQMSQDANAASINKEATINRAVSKSSKAYNNSSWDLVDAMEDKNFEIEEIKIETLPAEMQKLNTEERKAYIEKKKKERIDIQSKITEFNKKRTKYLAEQKKDNTEEMLDAAMIKAVKKQAISKRYKFIEK